MTTFLFVATIYTFVVLAIVIVGGTLRLRYLKKQKQCFNFPSTVDDSVDERLDGLSIEASADMVSSHVLARRGSWRIALDQVMPAQTFEEMKAEEYSKKL